MTNQESLEWFAGEIHHLQHLTRLTALQREKLEAYTAAEQALKTAEANAIHPHWYGKLKEEFWR